MRDQTLQRAIDTVGGVSVLAKKLHITQPSVSGWLRVPANRVLQVERLTGISRYVLRPDIYGRQPQ